MNSTSLQGLVAQLANFESNFIQILTQAALRMSDLSGRELFLLVKSQTGTYFAGSRELCAAYKIGTLMPASPNEVHLKKDDPCEVCARNEAAASSAAATAAATAAAAAESHSTPPPPPLISRKRLAETSSAQTASSASPAKKTNVSASTSKSASSAAAPENHYVPFQTEVKSEPQSDPNHDAIALDDDDDDEIIWEEAEAATSWAAAGAGQQQQQQQSHHHQQHQQQQNGFYLDDSHQHFGFDAAAAVVAAAVSDESRRYCPTAKELFEAKVKRLKSLRPDEVFVKRSREHQLLSTVMYGFGRDLALEFVEETKKRQERDKDKEDSSAKEKLPPMLSKANYFHKKYENFVLQFPELTEFKTKIKRSKNQIVSAGMYIKNIAQKAFYKRVKKEEDVEATAAAAAARKVDAGGGGGGGGAGGADNGVAGNDSSSSAADETEPKLETGLINPITGFPEPDFDDPYFDDEDDDDIIFL